MATEPMDFAEFYASAKDDCLRAVLAAVGDLPTAEDLVAEAFARAWAAWRKVSGHPSPQAWVVRTALNTRVSWWRRRRREVALGQAERLAAGSHPAASATPAQLTAWTVTKGPGDTVTILIRQLRDPAGMQRKLRADGVPAHVAFQGGTISDTPPLPRECSNTSLSPEEDAALQSKILGNSFVPGVQDRIALVIDAAEIPKGIGLNLTVQTSANGRGGASAWCGPARCAPAPDRASGLARPAKTSRRESAGPGGAGSRGRPC